MLLIWEKEEFWVVDFFIRVKENDMKREVGVNGNNMVELGIMVDEVYM